MTPLALIIIDIQNDYFPEFEGCKMPLPHMADAATNAGRLLSKARRDGWLVVHIRHISAFSNAPFFRPGTEGSEIHTSVFPSVGEEIVVKGKPNSFRGTNLAAILKGAGIEALTVCGAMSQMCVDATVRAAVDMGFDVTLAHDACAAADVVHDGVDVPAKLVHAAIMAPLASSYAKVVTTDACL